jgi:hypothetical protein
MKSRFSYFMKIQGLQNEFVNYFIHHREQNFKNAIPKTTINNLDFDLI